jgi:hypothetical protein
MSQFQTYLAYLSGEPRDWANYRKFKGLRQ